MRRGARACLAGNPHTGKRWHSAGRWVIKTARAGVAQRQSATCPGLEAWVQFLPPAPLRFQTIWPTFTVRYAAIAASSVGDIPTSPWNPAAGQVLTSSLGAHTPGETYVNLK